MLPETLRVVLARDLRALAHEVDPYQNDELLWRTRSGAGGPRLAALEPAEESQALSLLTALAAIWTEIQPAERVRNGARRLLRVHPLRAANAMQLAAALNRLPRFLLPVATAASPQEHRIRFSLLST